MLSMNYKNVENKYIKNPVKLLFLNADREHKQEVCSEPELWYEQIILNTQ